MPKTKKVVVKRDSSKDKALAIILLIGLVFSLLMVGKTEKQLQT